MTKPTPTLPNIHPVDELQALREEMKQLEARSNEIRDGLLSGAIGTEGDNYVAKLVPSKRQTVDTKALIEMFGEEAIAPFLKVTEYKTVKIVEK